MCRFVGSRENQSRQRKDTSEEHSPKPRATVPTPTTLYLLSGSVGGMGQESEELSFETVLTGAPVPRRINPMTSNELFVPLNSQGTEHQV